MALIILNAHQHVFQGAPGGWRDALAFAAVVKRDFDNEGINLANNHAHSRQLASGLTA
ncbi:hypothetical protein D3C85_1904400 [compost metagenome]